MELSGDAPASCLQYILLNSPYPETDVEDRYWAESRHFLWPVANAEGLVDKYLTVEAA